MYPPRTSRESSCACCSLLISMTCRSGSPARSLIPLLPVVSSALSRPVTVTSPRGAGGTSGNAVWLGAAGTQPRLTRTVPPPLRSSGVSTCTPILSSAEVRRRTTTSCSVSNVPVAVTARQ